MFQVSAADHCPNGLAAETSKKLNAHVVNLKELTKEMDSSITKSNECTTMMCEIQEIAKTTIGTIKLIFGSIKMTIEIPKTLFQCTVLVFREVFPRKLAQFKED